MNLRSLPLLPLCLLAGARLMAGWPAIPPETWATKDDAARTGAGAVILEKVIHLDEKFVEYDYRVRIFSERGKTAGQFAAFPGDTLDLRGRTVLPDGKVIAFNSSKDFQTKTLAAVGYGEVQRKLAVAPGLTGDCVVDLHWREPRHYKHWSFDSEVWDLAEPCPVKVLRIEIPQFASYSYTFTPDRQTHFESSTARGFLTITLQDLRAMEELPFSLKVTRDFPRLGIYNMDADLSRLTSRGGDIFWPEVAKRWKNAYVDRVDRGKAYRLFSESLRAGLPEGPQARAMEIYRRLNTQIINLDQLSYEESVSRPKAPDPEPREHQDLNGAARRGTSRTLGMRYLYMNLLLDAGIHPLLVEVADRNNRRFSKKELNVYQFDDACLVVEEPGKPPLWVYPGLRLAPPGFVFRNYQGTSAFGVDTTDWTPRFLSVPAEPSGANQDHYAFTLELQEDQDLITGTETLTGQDAYALRRHLFDKDPAARTRILREGMERAAPGFTLLKASVDNAGDPSRDLVVRLEGRMEREGGRRRMVTPFPFMPAPFEIPDDLPSSRTEPIIMPYLQIQSAVCRFKVPKGYVLAQTDPLEQRNLFGSVSWKAVQGEGGEVEVALRIEAATFVAMGHEMARFKEFLAWVKDACTRGLSLEKA